jgi:hypothetical protein
MIVPESTSALLSVSVPDYRTTLSIFGAACGALHTTKALSLSIYARGRNLHLEVDMALRIPSIRISPDRDTVTQQLGLLQNLAGTWEGRGFNLIARPDKEGGGPLFLELNQTREILKVDPIASSIPNRGFGQDDIELFGLTYLQKISDSTTGGALHIEPGIWVTQPGTTAPPETPAAGQQIIARMATIPHGNALLAQGAAIDVTTLTGGTFQITPVNTAPFGVGTPMPPGGTQGGFPPYDLSNTTAAATDFRTPFGDNPAVPLPASIDTVPMQTVINDPTRLLQQAIKGQFIEQMVVLNIATAASIDMKSGQVPVAFGAGGIENMPFLVANADAALVFATFWIEKIKQGTGHFLQLQYVQTVILNFPILGTNTNLSWPHVSVATLQKTFG